MKQTYHHILSCIVKTEDSVLRNRSTFTVLMKLWLKKCLLALCVLMLHSLFLNLEPTGKMINVEARSSKELVYVAVDGVRVYENAVEGGNSRGLHIIVLSQHTGDIMAKRIFDTYAQLLDDEILLFLKTLQEGRIVIFLVKVLEIVSSCFCSYFNIELTVLLVVEPCRERHATDATQLGTSQELTKRT